MARRGNVMISYKRNSNETCARELYDRLEQAKLSPWLDRIGIKAGSRWRDELLKELRACDAFLPLLTPDYIRSEHCRMELFIARSRGCPVLPVVLEDCFDLLDEYEETKGLADVFMVRLYRLSLVGLPITREEAMQRVVQAAQTPGEAAAAKEVYVSYCNDEAEVATRLARELQGHGLSTWVATQDCRVGDNWRQAQARGVMQASVQVVVLDESIAKAEVLRTEIMLAEAFGLPVFVVFGPKLASEPATVARVMNELGSADVTYRRLTEIQAFDTDKQSVAALATTIRSVTPQNRPRPIDL
jgi:hypothetical protein